MGQRMAPQSNGEATPLSDSQQRWPPHALTHVLLALGMAASVALATWVLRQQYSDLSAPSPEMRRQLVQLNLAPGLYAGALVVIEAFTALGFWLVAALIAWRRSDDHMALFVALMLTAFGVALPGTCYAIAVSRPIWSVPGGPLQALGWLLLVPFACLFPDGRFVPSWSRYLLPFWVLWVIAFFTGADAITRTNPIVFALTFLVWVGGLGAGVLAQIYRYRAISTPTQQQQTKWVVLGFAAAVPGLGVALIPHIAALMLGHPIGSGPAFQLASLVIFCIAALLLPTALGIAVLRHQLYDVDLVINRALVYGSLTVVLALVYVIGVVISQALVGGITHTSKQSPIAVVLTTLVIAALFQPARHRIQAIIDRRFYRRKYDAARTLAAFAATLREQADLTDLTNRLLAAVGETMQPAHASLWLRQHEPPNQEHPPEA